MSERFFFDTSALIKLYHEEKGTDQLGDLIDSENPDIVAIDEAIKDRTLHLLKTIGLDRGLKSLDALQLATALTTSESSSLDLFIAADKILGEIAGDHELDVLIV